MIFFEYGDAIAFLSCFLNNCFITIYQNIDEMLTLLF